jgi:ATP-dependent Clp protease ATP-binding subunit ClpA
VKSAREFLISKGFDRALGARPLRRAIERHLEDPLAEEILRGGLAEGGTIEALARGEELVFRMKSAPAASHTA